ncbi:pseudouridine-5'-phosphate glycosidase [Carboxydochorda subterranea]|uniref:Pseudouridine-5'-phosphate glycosidase n=1 Tax=Carboxydichorda subterranea TaxID=3109565 RepID=A0ABZ1BVF3_9FIRM|nr:pseudouridine-5'-phosphate glycosidase [Limnochorda sp. L945t]WRP16590.1 pseudouridine-5'-phosphate glycosidase [Limnochorda sp. L945t]
MTQRDDAKRALPGHVGVSEEVAAALPSGRVVALESSLICQGMPWPHNLETGLQAEEAVRTAGATPATVAILEGQVRIGLSRAQLEALARREDAVKVGIREIPWTLLRHLTGGTTVSATMALAALAGIRVFATGGIGGVHGSHDLDISADLVALARFDMVVVSSGAKSFLDIPATLEVLETLGVPVIGYRTGDFPGFFVRTTGYPLPMRADEVEDIVRFARLKWKLRLPGAVLVVNPAPEADAADPAAVDRAIRQARQEAAQRGIRGQRVTPFILETIRQLTGGQSLKANKALVVDNAALAARIAVRLANAPVGDEVP